MPAALGSEAAIPGIARLGVALLGRFVSVGIAATILYGGVAILLVEWKVAALGMVSASMIAYAVAALFSYLGHKFVTFMSPGSHRVELPRFLALTGVGFAIAGGLSMLFAGMPGVPHYVPVLLTCVTVPIINFVVMDWWVFASRKASPAGKLR